MGKLEDAFNGRIRDKYGGIEKLEVESEPKFSMTMIDDSQKQTTPNYHKQFLQGIKDRYGCEKLECQGLLGFLIEQRTLANAEVEDAHLRMQGKTLKTSTANFQGKPVRVWLEVSK